MFGQHVNHGFPVFRLCWLHRERESGELNLLRETMMMGATVRVQTSNEWRLSLKQIYFSTASMILFFFSEGNTISHGEIIPISMILTLLILKK